jgi:hypothetical protein
LIRYRNRLLIWKWMTEDQYLERERAAIMEFDGGMSKEDADVLAAEWILARREAATSTASR